MKKFTSRFISLLLAVLMIGMMLPMTAFAEAGDWDPLTDPDTVYGDLVGTEQFSASTSLDSGKDGYLRMMPILTAGNYDYNAMAYCGATASSNDPDIVDVKSIEIGAWQGGAWDGADCLQVTVNPKSAGTTVVVINFYYTFSQSSSPFTNPNAQWFYGTMRYTVKVNGPVAQDITLSYDANGGAGAPAAQTQTVAAGQNAVFTISSTVPTRDGYIFLGWSLDRAAYAADYQPNDSITLSTSDTLYAVWEEETADTFTVTYTDGVDGEVVFADDIHPNLTEGTATPPFSGGTPTRPGYVFKGWSPTVPATVTADATYTAQWEEEAPKPGNVHIYIYRAGNLSKPVVSTKLDANVGDVLDLSELDINDYYASSHGFETAGWFNDGGFNDYKAGRNPSALAELTVSGGWQNLIAVVTDYQRVIVKSVVDGNKDDAADIFDEKVLTGTDLITFLEANVVIQDMEGHTLEKWYNWDWYGHKFGADTPVTGWTNVYVNYVPNEYTVTFDTANGDTPSTVSVKHGQTVVRPADPIKDGCNFVGWFDAAGNIFDFDTPITSDTTLTAKWERADGNIHIYIYRAGDLERPVIHNILEAKVNDTLDLTELDINDYYASSQGFESAGWFNDGKFNEYKAGKAPEALSELKVTGQWQNVIAVVADYEKVIVKSVINGNKDTAQDIYTGKALKDTNLIEFLEEKVNLEVPANHSVEKWYKWDAFGTGFKFDAQDTVNGWTNVYVNFIRNTYTVHYTDGVKGEVIFEDCDVQVPVGDPVPSYPHEVPTRKGYVLYGWKTRDVNGDGSLISCTAQWEKDENNNGVADKDEEKYTVKYTDGVKGVTVFSDQEYTGLLAGTDTPAFAGELKREGYQFNGWKPSVSATVTGSVTYTATWKSTTEPAAKFTVTYTDGVDDAEVFADQVYAGLEAGAKTPSFTGTPHRDGYTFRGWSPAVTDTVTKDTVYSAVWEKNSSSGSENPYIPYIPNIKDDTQKEDPSIPGKTTPPVTEPNTPSEPSNPTVGPATDEADATTISAPPQTGSSYAVFCWTAPIVAAGLVVCIFIRKKDIE